MLGLMDLARQGPVPLGAIFDFLKTWHGITIRVPVAQLFPPDNFRVDRVGNFVVAAHGPTSSVYLLAWDPLDNPDDRSSLRFIYDAVDVRTLAPKLKMYRNWYYFVTNLPPDNEVPADHSFQYGRMEWPTEPSNDDEEEEEDNVDFEGWNDSYEYAQGDDDDDDDDVMFGSEDLVWGESSEELPGPPSDDDDDDEFPETQPPQFSLSPPRSEE